MEHSQTFNIPLDAPIDFDSADMLSIVNDPTLSLNRQQYQGSVLPNSLRYEHDGYFAGNHAHEFNHVPGAKIKDDQNKEYSVLKHQAYYAPVYHIESVDGAFALDYYPLTAVIQSNEPVIIDNSNPSYFRLDGIASIDRDSFTVTPDSGFELIEHTFDPKLFVHDFIFVDTNSVLNDNATITCGIDSQLGFDIFPYSYEHGTHKWGEQYTLNDLGEFSSSDGVISKVSISDTAISFDYNSLLSVTDTINITMDSVFDFAFSNSSFDTTMSADSCSVETVSNITSVYIPTWWSVNGLNKSAYSGYTQLPVHDKESIVMYKGPTEQKELYVKMKLDFAAVRAATMFTAINFDIDDVEMPVIEQMRSFAYDTTKHISDPVITKQDSYVSGSNYPHECLFTIKYSTDYTRFDLRIPSITFTVWAKEGTKNHIATIKIDNFPICIDIDDFTDHSKDNWAAFKKNCNNANIVFNDISDADKSIPMISDADVTILQSDGYITRDNITTLVQAINNNLAATISYDIYNCIEQIGDTTSPYFSGNGECFICLEDPYVEFPATRQVDVATSMSLRCPWTSYYASRVSVNSADAMAGIFQLQSVNGEKIEADSNLYCQRYIEPIQVNIPLDVYQLSISSNINLPFYYQYVVSSSALNISFTYDGNKMVILGAMLGAYLTAVSTGKLKQRDDKEYRALLRVNSFGHASASGSSFYTAAYDPSAVLTFSEGNSYSIGVSVKYALSEYLKNIVTQTVLDTLAPTNDIPYAFMEVSNNLNTLKQDHTVIERARSQNMSYCKFNSLDDINNFFFQSTAYNYKPETDYYLLKDTSYKSNAAPLCKFVQSGSATSSKPQYFALLINGKLSIETFINEQAQQVDGKVIDAEPKGMVLDLQDVFVINAKNYTFDRINGKAVLQTEITGRVYDYLGEGQYPTDPTEVPQYIKMGSVDYNLASDDLFTAYTLGRDDSLYINTTYNVKEYRHVANASIVTNNEWQHGLATALADTSVSVDNDVIHVSCGDTTQDYDIIFDSSTYKATMQHLNGATFIENDVGNYTVKRDKSYNEHITLTKAKLDTDIALTLDSVIGGVYTVSGYECEIMFSQGDRYFDISSALNVITVDNVVFNADSISFNVSGNKVISAMVTIEDMYNLKGITRGAISNDTITFNS